MDKIKIGPLEWNIVQVPLDGKELNHSEYLGSYTQAELTIRIASDMPDSVREVTIWHEIIHILANQRNITLEESQVDALAFGLIEFLIDNNLDTKILSPKP